MKKIFILFFLSYLLISYANAQKYLILKNGEQIEYKKYKIKSKDQEIEIKNPNPQVIKISEIDYLINNNGELRYIRERLNKDLGVGELINPDFIEMEKFIEGKISIYSYTITSGSRTYVYAFLEKGDEFIQIFNNEMLEGNRKNNIETIQPFVEDDGNNRDKLISDSFKATNKNILELIRQYNLNALITESINSNDFSCDVVLYRGYMNQEKDLTAEITINDQVFTLNDMNYKKIKVDEVPTKICISNGETTFCDLISGSKHIEKYYEIQIKNKDEIAVEIKNKNQYKRYINALNASYKTK